MKKLHKFCDTPFELIPLDEIYHYLYGTGPFVAGEWFGSEEGHEIPLEDAITILQNADPEIMFFESSPKIIRENISNSIVFWRLK